MKTDSFVQPLPTFAGTYPNWSGYVHLQPRTPEGLPNLLHIGDDYNGAGGGDADLGQNVVSVATGVVEITIPWNGNYGYGNHMFIRHEITEALRKSIKTNYNIDTQILYSHYAHLKDFTVKAGQTVSKGQVIAHLGKTGTKFAHLHCEIRKPTGMGYEDYPSDIKKKSWVQQYYVAPFPFIEKYKSPLSDTPQLPTIQQVHDIIWSNDSEANKLYKLQQLIPR